MRQHLAARAGGACGHRAPHPPPTQAQLGASDPPELWRRLCKSIPQLKLLKAYGEGQATQATPNHQHIEHIALPKRTGVFGTSRRNRTLRCHACVSGATTQTSCSPELRV